MPISGSKPRTYRPDASTAMHTRSGSSSCQWYRGTVGEYDEESGEHLVQYDDGEKQYEELDVCRPGASTLD